MSPASLVIFRGLNCAHFDGCAGILGLPPAIITQAKIWYTYNTSSMFKTAHYSNFTKPALAFWRSIDEPLTKHSWILQELPAASFFFIIQAGGKYKSIQQKVLVLESDWLRPSRSADISQYQHRDCLPLVSLRLSLHVLDRLFFFQSVSMAKQKPNINFEIEILCCCVTECIFWCNMILQKSF